MNATIYNEYGMAIVANALSVLVRNRVREKETREYETAMDCLCRVLDRRCKSDEYYETALYEDLCRIGNAIIDNVDSEEAKFNGDTPMLDMESIPIAKRVMAVLNYDERVMPHVPDNLLTMPIVVAIKAVASHSAWDEASREKNS